jgi:hypothetical protein
LDAAPARSELHRIGQQVPDDLLQPGGIARYIVGCRVEIGFEVDLPRFHRRMQGVCHAFYEGNQSDVLNFESQAARTDVGDIQQVVDEPCLRIGAGFDLRQGP